MWQRSDRFRNAIEGNHRMGVVVGLQRMGRITYPALEILDGNVRMGKEQVERACDIHLADPKNRMSRSDLSSLFDPLGLELLVYRGVVFSDGTQEMIPLGVYSIARLRIDDSGDGYSVTIDSYDRSRVVARAKITSTLAIASGTNVGTAIQTIIEACVGTFMHVVYDFDTLTYTTPQMTLNIGDDGWKAATNLATESGCRLYFDGLGRLCLTKVLPAHRRPVVRGYTEGPLNRVMYIDHSWNDSDLKNYVIGLSENSDLAAPLISTVYDDDPSSPTYIYGPAGRVVEVVRSNEITTQAQLDAYTQLSLDNLRGYPEEVNITNVVDPSLELDDIVTIDREASGISYRCIVDSITVPLRHDRAQNLGLRRVGVYGS